MGKRTLLVVLVVVIAAVAAVTVFLVGDREEMGNRVRIGVILPLTGDGAAYGSSMRRGMDLAAEELASTLPYELVLIYEDSQADPTKALSAYRKLADVDQVPAILGPFTSSETLAVAPAAEADDIVILSTGASSPEVTNAGDFIFRIVTSDFFDADVVARYSIEHLGIREMAVVFINNEYGTGVRDVFSPRFQELGGTVLSVEGYLPDDPDFRTLLAKVRDSRPDGLFLVGHQEMGRVLRQAREIGIESTVVSTGLFQDPAILETAGPAAEGVFFSYASYNPQSEDVVLGNFVATYEEKYGENPNILAALGYDAVRLLGAVIAGAGASGRDIRDGLYRTQGFEGVTGEMSFDSNGDVVKSFGIKKVQDGQFVWVINKF